MKWNVVYTVLNRPAINDENGRNILLTNHLTLDVEEANAIACLAAAAPRMLAALEHDVIELANLAAMVDPKQTEEYMTSVYAAIHDATKGGA